MCVRARALVSNSVCVCVCAFQCESVVFLCVGLRVYTCVLVCVCLYNVKFVLFIHAQNIIQTLVPQFECVCVCACLPACCLSSHASFRQSISACLLVRHSFYLSKYPTVYSSVRPSISLYWLSVKLYEVKQRQPIIWPTTKSCHNQVLRPLHTAGCHS